MNFSQTKYLSSTAGWFPDDDGAFKESLCEEQFPLPQRQNAKGRNHQTYIQRRGKILTRFGVFTNSIFTLNLLDFIFS